MAETNDRPVVLIADKLATEAVALFGAETEVRYVDGTDRGALLDAVGEVDAIVVRSATTIDNEVLAAAHKLRVVARAGVGLDNVEVPAATERGVMVVNAPTSNIVSAAEHAVALVLACARNIGQADASLRQHEWRRSEFTGMELDGKTVGVIGFGRIGQLFAQRIGAFGTNVVAYDPFVAASRASQLGVRVLELEDVLAEADIISVHLPKTQETMGLLDEKMLAKCKPGAIVVNAARGGLVDEQALAEAVSSGHLAGAGVDVYSSEPCTDSPLFDLPQTVVTPHLGASTKEAQLRAGTEVVRSVMAALRGEFVPDAVNVQSTGPIGEDVRPYVGLAQKLGAILVAMASDRLVSVQVEVRGELSTEDVSVLPLAALRGIFDGVVDEPVTFVNAPQLAEERGVNARITTESESPDHRSLLTVRGEQQSGERVSVSGTVTGVRMVEKLVEVNGRHFDFRAEGNMMLLNYPDRPGVMGTVGTMLGEAGVNIEGAQISQATDSVDSIMTLRVDRVVGAEVLDALAVAVGAGLARSVRLD